MSRTVEYRCLNCLDQTVVREFDVSHLSVTCDSCDEFSRFVHGRVFEQFETFESSPPDEIDWEQLDRVEKLLVAERLVRSARTLEDFEVASAD